MSVVCYEKLACVEVRLGLSIGALVSRFLGGLFYLLCPCCGCRIVSPVPHRPSSSQALYFVAATVQQQSHRTRFGGPLLVTQLLVLTTMRVCCVRYGWACV